MVVIPLRLTTRRLVQSTAHEHRNRVSKRKAAFLAFSTLIYCSNVFYPPRLQQTPCVGGAVPQARRSTVPWMSPISKWDEGSRSNLNHKKEERVAEFHSDAQHIYGGGAMQLTTDLPSPVSRWLAGYFFSRLRFVGPQRHFKAQWQKY